MIMFGSQRKGREWLRWDKRRQEWRPATPWWRQPACWVAIAMAVGAAVNQYRAVTAWTPLQRAYVVSYAWSALACRVGWSNGTYRMLYLHDRAGKHIATDAEVATTEARGGADPLRLSDAAVRAGGRRLEWVGGLYPHEPVYGFLRVGVYGDRRPRQLLVPAGRGALVGLLIMCVLPLVPPVWHVLLTALRDGLRRLRRPRAFPQTPPADTAATAPLESAAPPEAVTLTSAAAQDASSTSPTPPPSPRPPAPFFE